MSRDETLRDKLARLRREHDAHTRHHRLDLDEMKDGLDLARQVQSEARRRHDEAHRIRDAERARRGGRKPLDAEAIAQAAVSIADAQGLDEVSMRKIAAVLGSGTMSLYHYVRTKEDLLAAMDDRIMAEILVPPGELKGGWRKAIGAIARATRAAYRRHPWALNIPSKGGQPGLNGLRHVEQSLAALAETDLTFEQKTALMLTVDDYVFGHALRMAGSDTEGAPEEFVDHVAAFMRGAITPEEYPQLHAVVGEGDLVAFVRRMADMFEPEQWFEDGLEAMLDGLALRFHLQG